MRFFLFIPDGSRRRDNAPGFFSQPAETAPPAPPPPLRRNEDSSAQAAVLTLKDVNTLNSYDNWPLHSWGSADAQAAQGNNGAVVTPYNQINGRVQVAVNGDAQSPAVLNQPRESWVSTRLRAATDSPCVPWRVPAPRHL